MPLITRSSYPGPPFWQINGHIQTIAPGFVRKLDPVPFTRERIHTPDDDFLDLDWWQQGSQRLLLLTHGLEGSTSSRYIHGMAHLFHQHGWDVLAWNCRSCSGEMNRQFRLYHHGDIEDISTVVDHALAQKAYAQIALVGFSMGANITMKYLGTGGLHIPEAVHSAVVFSAPCALESASDLLDRWDNFLYKNKFEKSIAAKLHIKDQHFPGRLNMDKMRDVKRWRDFDEWFSAPMCGYKDADEFYAKSSARNFIEGIRVPTLLVNAWNDPILSADCMPTEQARQHPAFFLETPQTGGHCGFMVKGDTFAWSERRALAFCENLQ